jgi:hypothetical protein
VVVAVATVLVVSPAIAAEPAVRWEHERVTARFTATPVADAVQAVAAATGAELRGTVLASNEVTVDLDAVPLDEALHRLVGAQNFTVRYGEGGRVKTIALEGGEAVATQKTDASPAAGVPVDAKPTFPIVLSRMFKRHRPLKLSDQLAERFGEEKASMPQLLELATGDDDGVTRALASQTVLSALEREARYRRSFLRSLHDLDSEELAAIAGGPNGERLEELLGFLAAHSREPTLQKKAGIVLEQLQEAGAPDS